MREPGQRNLLFSFFPFHLLPPTSSVMLVRKLSDKDPDACFRDH